MNRRPFRRSFNRRGGRPLARKALVWGNFVGSSAESFGTVAKTLVDFTTWNNAWVGNANGNATLVRVRGFIHISQFAQTTADPVFMYIGLSDAGETITAANTAATYNDEDVLWRWVGHPNDAHSLTAAAAHTAFTALEIDIKAKRKLLTDSVLNLVITTALPNWTLSVNLGGLVTVG